MINGVDPSKILAPANEVDLLAGNDSHVLKSGNSTCPNGSRMCISHGIVLTGSHLPDDGVAQPFCTMRVTHRPGHLGSILQAGSIDIGMPADRPIVCPDSGLQLRIPLNPMPGSNGDVQDDCGSAALTDLLTFADTTIPSSELTSSCDSQTDLADPTQATFPGRLSFVSVNSYSIPPECDNECLQSGASQPLDDDRHHGGYVAAAALKDENARLSQAGQGSEPCNFVPSQAASTSHFQDAQNMLDTALYGDIQNSSAQEDPVEPYARRLSSSPSSPPARIVIDGEAVSELLAAASTSAGQLSNAATRSATTRRICPTGDDEGPPHAAPTAPLQEKHGSFPFEGQMATSAAGFSPSKSLLPIASCRMITVRPYAGAAAAAVATAAAVSAAADEEIKPSPFAACELQQSKPPLVYELPDSSVHGGRPRHPSLDPALQPYATRLLEWAEVASAANSRHLSSTSTSPAVPVVIRFGIATSSAVPFVVPGAPSDMGQAAPAAAAARREAQPLLRDQQSQLQALCKTPTWVLLLVLVQRLLHTCLWLPVVLICVAVLQPFAICHPRMVCP